MATGTNRIPSQDNATTGRSRNGLNWHLRDPAQGPARLAVKNHFVAMVGEYVGTCLFMIFALGGTNVANIPSTSVTGATTAGQSGTAASAPNTSNLLYIALSFGFSLAVNAWIFFRISGGLFNPAVSLAMALVGALTPLRAALLSFSQILGGITGAAIIQALLPGTLNVRTTLSAGTSIARGLFIEMFLTALLMLTILLLAAEKNKATFIAPVGIGLALFIAELLGVYYTGGSLNPARSFGPDVVLKTFSGYHWIYWLGPAMGATLAAGFYKFIKYLEYETVLGPESDGEPVKVVTAIDPNNNQTQILAGSDTSAAAQQQQQQQPHAMQGNNLEKSGGATTQNSSRREASSKGQRSGEKDRRMEVMGPGIGDLLTSGPGEETFDLPAYNKRLERIENMLTQLLVQRHDHPPQSSLSAV